MSRSRMLVSLPLTLCLVACPNGEEQGDDDGTAAPLTCVDLTCSEGSHCEQPDALVDAACACDPGWLDDGGGCADLDECAGGLAICDPNATCTNLPGSFVCECGPGWEGDGTTCTDVDECALALDGCGEDATCVNTEGSYRCECAPGWTWDGAGCVEVATSLSGLRWDMPCQSPHGLSDCPGLVHVIDQQAVLGGDPGVVYDVTLRFRGVIEQQTYLGGVQDGYWLEGGSPENEAYNVYRVSVADPPGTWFLNAGTAWLGVSWPIDYQRTVPMRGGTTVSLFADDGDGWLTTNRDESGQPIVIPDVPPYPEVYDGQFIQMDVVSVVPRSE